jgi:hypothetical protein
MIMLDDGGNGPDDVGVEALWTLALLSYARAFADGEGGAALTTKDLVGSDDDGNVLLWHRALLHLRDQHADQSRNPRESYTVGIAQGPSGAVNAVAVTSVRAPLVDKAAVRQAGAIAFPLCAVLDERIDPLQKEILADMRDIALHRQHQPGRHQGRHRRAVHRRERARGLDCAPVRRRPAARR